MVESSRTFFESYSFIAYHIIVYSINLSGGCWSYLIGNIRFIYFKKKKMKKDFALALTNYSTSHFSVGAIRGKTTPVPSLNKIHVT